MAAASHDAGHGGKNNDFLIKSKSKLLSEHNAPSVLENYHLHRTFDLINNNKYMEKFANIDAILSEDNSPSKNSTELQLQNKNKNKNKYKNKNNNKNKNKNSKKNNGINVDDESKIVENEEEENDCNFFQTFDASEQIKMEKIMRFAILGTDMNTYHKSIRDELSNPKDKPQDVYTSYVLCLFYFSSLIFYVLYFMFYVFGRCWCFCFCFCLFLACLRLRDCLFLCVLTFATGPRVQGHGFVLACTRDIVLVLVLGVLVFWCFLVFFYFYFGGILFLFFC